MNKRLLTLLLAAVMLIGCAQIATAEEEPVKISVASYMFGPVDEELDKITPAIEARLKDVHGLNVDIDIVYIEYSEYSEILNTRLAGGQAPDVFLSMSYTTMLEQYDQGVIASWDEEFFKENAPDVYAFITGGTVDGRLKDYVDMWREYSFIGDKMVTVAKIKEDGSMPYKSLLYRGDFLDALGVTEEEYPKTVDDFVALMYRFAKEDPDGNGVDDTYGIGASGVKPFFGAYGMYCGFIGGDSYWYEKDGEILNPDVSDASKEIIGILADMYADGVIDPEFVTGTESVPGSYWGISGGFVNGRIGASAHASIDHFRLKEVNNDNGGQVAREYWAVNGEDSKFVYAPWPAGPDGDYGYCVGYPVSIGENAVYNAALNDNPEKLALIFKVLNAFATDDELSLLAVYGIEGEHYNADADTGLLKRNPDLTNPDFNAAGVWAVRSLYGADTPYSDTMYRHAFYNDKTIKNRLDWYAKDQYNSYIMNAVSVVLPSKAALQPELNTLRDETWVAMIRGEKSLDEWDAYVETYMQLGGEQLYNEANEWYNNK